MPSLMNKDPMQTHQTLHKFQFSGVELDKLGASGYTIVTIVQDTSTSVTDFKDDMEKTLKQILEACAKSPRSEQLLLRLVEFNSSLNEIHGFRELRTIDAGVIDFLNGFKDEAGFDQFVEMGAATPAKLAKLAAFVSQSVSSTSQALGTGQPSQPLTF